MKKQYQQPIVKQQDFQPTLLMANSITENTDTTTQNGGTFRSNGRRGQWGDLWDDTEE